MKKEKLKCEKHPKYKGKKPPKRKVPCLKCFEIYLLISNKPRILPMPTKVIKDKSKYNRKKKHKNKED